VPLSGGFGLPSQTTLGLALPPRVIVYPSASVAMETVGPSYLSVARSIVHEPFHGLSCARQGRVKAIKHARAQTLMTCCFIGTYLGRKNLGPVLKSSAWVIILLANANGCQGQSSALGEEKIVGSAFTSEVRVGAYIFNPGGSCGWSTESIYPEDP
jgi:hypothetical protein